MALELPDWLVDLLEREGGMVDRRSAAGRMASVGVTEVGWLGFPGSPDALVARGPGLDMVLDVGDHDAPVTAALQELLTFLQNFGALRQLHGAEQDMDLVAEAARDLANRSEEEYRHTDQVLETGL